MRPDRMTALAYACLWLLLAGCAGLVCLVAYKLAQPWPW
jgi:hypothetical protein